MLSVTIESCTNGYVIVDEMTGKTYIAHAIDGFYSQQSIVGVLKTIEEAVKPKVPTVSEAELKV
jgi:hypothetical protein